MGGVLFHPFFIEWWCRVVQYIKTGYLLYIKSGEKLYFGVMGSFQMRSSKGVHTRDTPAQF